MYLARIEALDRSDEMKNLIKQMVVYYNKAMPNEEVRPTVAEFISNS